MWVPDVGKVKFFCVHGRPSMLEVPPFTQVGKTFPLLAPLPTAHPKLRASCTDGVTLLLMASELPFIVTEHLKTTSYIWLSHTLLSELGGFYSAHCIDERVS